MKIDLPEVEVKGIALRTVQRSLLILMIGRTGTQLGLVENGKLGMYLWQKLLQLAPFLQTQCNADPCGAFADDGMPVELAYVDAGDPLRYTDVPLASNRSL